MAMDPNVVRAQGDLLRQNLWDIMIPAVPGGGNPLLLTVLARTGSVPEAGSESVEIPFKNRTIRLAGRVNTHGTMDASFLMDKNGSVYDALYNWKQLSGSNQEGYVQDPAAYKTTVYVKMHDGTDTEQMSFRLDGVFIESLQAIDLDATGNEPVTVNVTFSYDGFEKE